MIRYQDAYVYASTAIGELPAEYADLFSSRFQYVFIDEYQDCNNLQRQAIDVIFDPQKCAVFKIGDSDQAIYNIAQCKALSLYDTGVTAEYGDKLITLSTCEYSHKNGRMVVVAKRIAVPSAEVGGDEA